MATTKVLLLGGHGKTTNPEITALGANRPGKITVLVESLDDVDTVEKATTVLDKVDPSIVIWSAGAGGKGGPSRTKAIDEVAAKNYITASLKRPKVKKFLMVSYIASRHGVPSWWNDDDAKAAEHVNTKVLAAYFAAKVEADEHFAAAAKRRNEKDPSFQAINLRPGALRDDPSNGKVMLGKTPSRGSVSRESVARVAAALLERDDTRGWYDLLDGDEPIEHAVERCVKEGWDGIVGEDLERIYAREL